MKASVLAILLSLAFAHAEDRIELAVPDDGRISLGVFDSSGRLVRTLHELATEDELEIGDNGIVTTWDGKSDAGKKVPTGTYAIRGYLVGSPVQVSGENFLFNDWSQDAGFPQFSKIQDFALLEDGDLLLLVSRGTDTSDLTLARFSPDKGFLWARDVWRAMMEGFPPLAVSQAPRTSDAAGHPLGGSVISMVSSHSVFFPPLIAANSSTGFLITAQGCGLFSLSDGHWEHSVHPGSGVAALAVATSDSTLFVSSAGGVAVVSLPSLTKETLVPFPADDGAIENPPFTSMDANPTNLIGASRGKVWLREESFRPITLPTPAHDVALGCSDTFWFVGGEANDRFVAQASFDGEILRAMTPDKGDPMPKKIRASHTKESFAVLESAPGLQRLRMMSKSDGWVIDWERSIQDNFGFGFLNGQPASRVEDLAANSSVRIRLRKNPLTNERETLELRPSFTPHGSRLVSKEGLPIVNISSRSDVSRIVLIPGDKASSIRLLQGNGAYVEEFSLSGLDTIVPLDGGMIEIP